VVRRYRQPRLPQAALYRSLVSGQRCLEVGGPSPLFDDDGALPLYAVVDRLDNCVYSSRTLWAATASDETFTYHPSKRPGKQIICEASRLGGIAPGSYQCILASHCLEHLANPLRGLAEWKRVLGADGLLVLVLPHKDGTFDWRRATTSIAHMLSDYESDIGEDDLTHLPEILALHDLNRDQAAGSAERFRARCLLNFANRGMHHHVFDTSTAVAIVDAAGFQILRVDTLKPHHIFILARAIGGQPDNARHRGPRAEYRRLSPFSSDRVDGR
jgi:SAM-dependent methyltransferase